MCIDKADTKGFLHFVISKNEEKNLNYLCFPDNIKNDCFSRESIIQVDATILYVQSTHQRLQYLFTVRKKVIQFWMAFSREILAKPQPMDYTRLTVDLLILKVSKAKTSSIKMCLSLN